MLTLDGVETDPVTPSVIKLLSTTTVALNANAATTLFTVPAGKRCVLTSAVLVLAADAVTTDVQIGQQGATDDFIPATDLGLIDAQYDCCILQPIPASVTGLSSWPRASGTSRISRSGLKRVASAHSRS